MIYVSARFTPYCLRVNGLPAPQGINYDPVTALTIASVGLTAGSMAESYSNAKHQSKAIKTQAAIDARQRVKETTATAASQKTSFLSSGINLTGEQGTTTTSILSDTYTKGKEDIQLIKENANTKLDALWSEQRSAMMKQLGGLALNVAGSGMFSGTTQTTQLGSLDATKFSFSDVNMSSGLG